MNKKSSLLPSEWLLSNKYWHKAMPVTHKLGAMWAAGRIMKTLMEEDVFQSAKGEFFVIPNKNDTGEDEIEHLHKLVQLEHKLKMVRSI